MPYLRRRAGRPRRRGVAMGAGRPGRQGHHDLQADVWPSRPLHPRRRPAVRGLPEGGRSFDAVEGPLGRLLFRPSRSGEEASATAAARTSALSSMWRGVHPAAQTDSEVVFASMCPARLPRPQAPGGRRVPDRPGPRPHWEDSTQWKMARQMTP